MQWEQHWARPILGACICQSVKLKSSPKHLKILSEIMIYENNSQIFLFNSNCCLNILSDKVKFNWFVILWLSVLQLSNEFIDHDKKVSVFGLYWDHELDPHVCHQLRVLNLFQSFYKGDINPLIVAAMAEQQISEPPLAWPAHISVQQCSICLAPVHL